MYYTCKFPDKPVTNAKNSPDYHWFLIATLYLCFIPNIVFLATDFKGTRCGPFTETDSGISLFSGAVNFVINKISVHVAEVVLPVLEFIFNPAVLISVIILLVLLVVLAYQRGEMFHRKVDLVYEELTKERQDLRVLYNNLLITYKTQTEQQKKKKKKDVKKHEKRVEKNVEKHIDNQVQQ